jgi:hypothetical protein
VSGRSTPLVAWALCAELLSCNGLVGIEEPEDTIRDVSPSDRSVDELGDEPREAGRLDADEPRDVSALDRTDEPRDTSALDRTDEPRDASALDAYGITTAPGTLQTAFEGDGGGPFDMPCPPNELVVGIKVVADDAVWGFGAKCGRLDLRRLASGEYVVNVTPASMFFPIVGGNIEGPPPRFALECPEATVVSAIAGTTWAPDPYPETLKMISLSCSKITVDATLRVILEPPISTLTAGIDTSTVRSFSFPCGPGAAVNGFLGRSGAFLDAFSVSCATLRVELP